MSSEETGYQEGRLQQILAREQKLGHALIPLGDPAMQLEQPVLSVEVQSESPDAAPVVVETPNPLSTAADFPQVDGTLYDHALFFQALIEAALAIDKQSDHPPTYQEEVRDWKATGRHFSGPSHRR